MKLNEKLKKLRLENGMTQKELANKLGVSVPSLQKYEYGTLNLKSDIIIKICEIFEIEPKNFLWRIRLTGKEKAEFSFAKLLFGSNDKRIKENVKNINFILEDYKNLKKSKYLLYFLASNTNVDLRIIKNERALEINFLSSVLKSEETVKIKIDDLESLLNILNSNIDLTLCNFIKLIKFNK